MSRLMNMSTLDKVHTSGPLLYSDKFYDFFYVYCREIFRAKADGPKFRLG